MSNYVPFLTYGAHSTKAYEQQRDRYDADEIIAFMTSGEFGGAITYDSQGRYDDVPKDMRLRFLDRSVSVKTVKAPIRDIAERFWSGESATCTTMGSVSLIAGVGGLTAAAITVAFLPVAICAAALGLGALGFSGLNFHRASQAKSELKKWTDPLAEAQALRKQVGIEGFNFAKKKGLKGKIVHKGELHQMWYNEIEHRNGELLHFETSSDKRVKRLRQFFANHPLATDNLHYAFGNQLEECQEAEKLRLFGAQFAHLRSLLKDTDKEYESKRSAIQAELSKELAAMKTRLQKALKPLESTRETMLKASEETLKQQISPFKIGTQNAVTNEIEWKADDNHPSVKAYRSSFEQEKSKIELMYTAAAAPIKAQFESMQQQMKQETSNKLDKLAKKAHDTILVLEKPVQELVRQYQNRNVAPPPAQHIYPQQGLYGIPEGVVLVPVQVPSAPYLPDYNPQLANQGISQYEWQEFLNRTYGN